jgi:NAD+ synthase (glutamine-hydrolysing)
VFVLNGKVLLIRPKQFLASDGNYREERWFSQWKHKRTVEDFLLPQCIRVITGASCSSRATTRAVRAHTCVVPR